MRQEVLCARLLEITNVPSAKLNNTRHSHPARKLFQTRTGIQVSYVGIAGN